MWDPPGPGLEPVPPALAGRFLTTVPAVKPHLAAFKERILFYFGGLVTPSQVLLLTHILWQGLILNYSQLVNWNVLAPVHPLLSGFHSPAEIPRDFLGSSHPQEQIWRHHSPGTFDLVTYQDRALLSRTFSCPSLLDSNLPFLTSPRSSSFPRPPITSILESTWGFWAQWKSWETPWTRRQGWGCQRLLFCCVPFACPLEELSLLHCSQLATPSPLALWPSPSSPAVYPQLLPSWLQPNPAAFSAYQEIDLASSKRCGQCLQLNLRSLGNSTATHRHVLSPGSPPKQCTDTDRMNASAGSHRYGFKFPPAVILSYLFVQVNAVYLRR